MSGATEAAPGGQGTRRPVGLLPPAIGRDRPAKLTVAGLTKTFQDRTVLREVSFNACGGEMVAITGASGCGKTTLLNCVGALEQCDGGEIVLALPVGDQVGQDSDSASAHTYAHSSRRSRSRDEPPQLVEVTDMSARQSRRFFRHTVGFVFQNAGLVDSWTVGRNLRVPVTRSGKLPSRDQIRQALEQVGADGLDRAMVYTLSGGEQQRVALARLLLKDPLLVLADEPMAALDSENAELVFTLLRQLADRGALVLMASHDSATVARCDREVRLPEPDSRCSLKERPVRIFGLTLPRWSRNAEELGGPLLAAADVGDREAGPHTAAGAGAL